MATQVNENKLLRENSIKIVGRLTDAHVTLGNRKDNGQGYISVDATVISLINGVSNEFKVNFYTNQLTKDGKTFVHKVAVSSEEEALLWKEVAGQE